MIFTKLSYIRFAVSAALIVVACAIVPCFGSSKISFAHEVDVESSATEKSTNEKLWDDRSDFKTRWKRQYSDDDYSCIYTIVEAESGDWNLVICYLPESTSGTHPELFGFAIERKNGGVVKNLNKQNLKLSVRPYGGRISDRIDVTIFSDGYFGVFDTNAVDGLKRLFDYGNFNIQVDFDSDYERRSFMATYHEPKGNFSKTLQHFGLVPIVDDLGTLQLHGKVRMMEEYREDDENNKSTYWFDTKGNLVKYRYNEEHKNDEEFNAIIRKNGQIKELGEQYGYTSSRSFTYNNEGRCISSYISEGHGYTSYQYTKFNKEGLPLEANVSSGFHHMDDQEDCEYKTVYRYLTFDKAGNWTKCRHESTSTSYTEQIYDKESCEYIEKKSTGPFQTTYEVIVRKIYYYDD